MEAAPVTMTTLNTSMNSARNANTGIYELLKIWFIRDTILDELCPADVNNFLSATVIGIEKKKWIWYVNPIRSIIQHKFWLTEMSGVGVTFTMICGRMYDIMDVHSWRSPIAISGRTFDVILIMTKNEKFVPLTSNILPKKAFENLYGMKTTISDELVTDYEPMIRHITVKTPDLTFSIKTPLTNKGTYLPLYFHHSVYGGALGPEDTILYANINTDEITKIKKGKNRFSKPYTIDEASRNIFSIRSTNPGMMAVESQFESDGLIFRIER